MAARSRSAENMRRMRERKRCAKLGIPIPDWALKRKRGRDSTSAGIEQEVNGHPVATERPSKPRSDSLVDLEEFEAVLSAKITEDLTPSDFRSLAGAKKDILELRIKSGQLLPAEEFGEAWKHVLTVLRDTARREIPARILAGESPLAAVSAAFDEAISALKADNRVPDVLK